MAQINDDILDCILSHVDAMRIDGRTEQMYCNLLLVCKRFRPLVTARLYRYPFLNAYKLRKFVATVTRNPSLAGLVRGITFDTRATFRYELNSPESEEAHREACIALRKISSTCTHLESLATNPRESWRLDPGLQFDPSDRSTDLFYAIFGYPRGSDAQVKISPFRHLHFNGINRSLEGNIFRPGWYAESTSRKTVCSLSLYNMTAASNLDYLLHLPHFREPFRLYVMSCDLSSAFVYKLLAYFSTEIGELHLRFLRAAIVAIPALEPSDILVLSELRISRTDMLFMPTITAPALREVHITGGGIQQPGKIHDWLVSSSTPILYRIVFDLSDAAHTYLPPGQAPAQTSAEIDRLQTLCRERAIQTEPEVRQAFQKSQEELW